MPYIPQSVVLSFRNDLGERRIDRRASRVAHNGFHAVQSSTKLRSALKHLSRYLAFEEAVPSVCATRIGTDPARVCAAPKHFRYDSQGGRSLQWLAGRESKSSLNWLGQASSNARRSCSRVAAFDNPLFVTTCNTLTGESRAQRSGCMRLGAGGPAPEIETQFCCFW